MHQGDVIGVFLHGFDVKQITNRLSEGLKEEFGRPDGLRWEVVTIYGTETERNAVSLQANARRGTKQRLDADGGQSKRKKTRQGRGRAARIAGPVHLHEV